MNQPYEPISYWKRAGRTYHDRFKRTQAFVDQEKALHDVIAVRQPADPDQGFYVLEAGCGFGRIAELLFSSFSNIYYLGFDLSEDQLRHARERVVDNRATFMQSTIEDWTDGSYDLVLAVEVLMHVKPEDLEHTVEKLCTYGPLITVDWTEPIEGPVAAHNFIHDYEAVGLKPVRKVGQQTIFSSDG